jgi:hypothetical protein
LWWGSDLLKDGSESFDIDRMHALFGLAIETYGVKNGFTFREVRKRFWGGHIGKDGVQALL